MMSALLTLLGVLLCSMNTHASVVSQKDFNLEKEMKTWVQKGLKSHFAKNELTPTLKAIMVRASSDAKDFYKEALKSCVLMGGKWYLFGIASNSEWFTAKKSEIKAGTVTMTPTAAGDLSLSSAGQNLNGACWRMTHLAEKTETPGKFTFFNQGWKIDMHIVDVKYDEYALVHTTKTKVGVSAVLIDLYTRDGQPSTELEKKFEELSKEATILPENIVILPNDGECPMD